MGDSNFNDSEDFQDFEDEKKIYQGHKIPLFVKLAWFTFILWMIIYLIIFLIPDLKQWI